MKPSGVKVCMSREAGNRIEGGGDRGVRDGGNGRGEAAASLSRQAWEGVESSARKASEPVSGTLSFDKPIYPNQQFAGLSTTMNDAGGIYQSAAVEVNGDGGKRGAGKRGDGGSGDLGRGDGNGAGEVKDPVVAKSSKRNGDGGYTDTSVHAGGTIDTTTYDSEKRAVKNRTDRPDGSFSEQTVDKNKDVTIREQKANGDYTETKLGHDGSISSKSHATNGDGSVTDTTTGANGVVDSTTTKGGKLIGKRTENPDHSFTERKVNADNSVTFHQEQKDGSYVETRTDKEGTSRTVHEVNEQGGSTTKTYDTNGNLVTDRNTQADGSYFETTKNKDGTTTKHDQDANGNFTEARFNDKGELVTPILDAKSTASTIFVNHVRDQINQMPDGVKKLLANDRTHIVASGMVLDAIPDAKDNKPRGHDEGKSWNDLDGAQSSESKRIVTAERTSDRANGGFSQRTDGVLKHETGHAVDRALGYDSNSAEFRAAYEKDIAAMTPAQKAAEKYQLQDGGAGRSEAYAEIYGAVNGSSANPSETAQKLATYPNTAEYMRKRLEGLNG
jgi:hypothetical protein